MHVLTFLLTLLAAADLDHLRSRADANQTCRREGFPLFIELLDGEGNLHEDQLRQPEHVHTLIDLPTNKTIEEVVQLFKGGSSHWINEEIIARPLRLGTRFWRVFRFSLRRWASCRLYCRAGRTSSKEKLFRGV